ncbi:MAG: hypothetical protein Q9M36_06465 [Sulfurovum sp.]|nr:hypothetical protein [Sulfurovum sp.]
MEARGFYLYSGRSKKDANITIQLLGTKAHALVGISLNLKGYARTDKMLRSFSIHLSMDGKTYTKVISGTLNVEDKEQFFSFSKSHHARYARLTLHDNQAQEPLGEITLGQWKVLAKQESMALEKALNIANPLLGGHVVKSSYYLSPYWDRNILTAKEENPYIRTYKGDKEELSFVLGFNHQRSAKITAIEWVESVKNS